MADKPSRALVLYAAGHAALLAGGGGGKGHLDAFASIASCGFLSVRTPAVNGTNPAPPLSRSARLLACSLKLRGFWSYRST